MRKYPLAETTKAALRARIAKGQKHEGLCCDNGREWMRKNSDLDSVWIEIINHWAYEALACSQTRPEDIAYHVQRFEKAYQANTWGD